MPIRADQYIARKNRGSVSVSVRVKRKDIVSGVFCSELALSRGPSAFEKFELWYILSFLCT